MGADPYPSWDPNGFHPPPSASAAGSEESYWAKWHKYDGDHYDHHYTNSNPFFDDFISSHDDFKKSPWEVLEIDKTDDESIIRKAYYKLARIYHPDKGGNEEDFKSLNDAYERAMRFV